MWIKNAPRFKTILCGFLVFALAWTLVALGPNLAVEAKTSESAPAENIFFYVTNSDGKNVLLQVMSLGELEAISHGQLSELMTGTDTGINYYFSCTDNLPTTVYTEARGITLPELVDYVKNNSPLAGASAISYTGSDKLYLMATDSNGVYNKNWTYDQLYGDSKYYFPGLFTSWNDAWEISDSTYGPTDSNPIPLDVYNSSYKANDSYYNAKSTVFSNGQPTIPILATKLEIARVLNLSSEIAANGGNVTGCQQNNLTTDRVLQLCLPQSEAVLMSGNRTAYHYFAWIYNMKLAMANAPEIASLGTVATPTATVTASGNTLSITMDCPTEGAKIYYSLRDGSPQTLYTGGAVSYDVTGRDLASSPITFAMTAVKEGYDDAGIISVTYPQRAPVFTDIYTASVGDDVAFTATSAVDTGTWNTWRNSISSVSIRYPGASAYTALAANLYTIDDSSKTITFDKSLFSTFGSHSFQISADTYANKIMSVTMKKAAPTAETTDYYMGEDIALSFADTSYQTGMSVSIKATEIASPNSISSSYLIQTVPGKLTLKKSYFTSANCVITAPGTYMLILNNSNYVPSSQSVSITVKAAAEKPPGDNFAYTLTPSASTARVGDSVTVSVDLISSADSYKFYAGEYRLVFDNACLTLDTVTTEGIWESGSKTADGQTILTFAALDMTDKGIDSGSSTGIGSFTVKPAKEGTASILCSQVLLTDANAMALSNVSGGDLQITVGDGLEPQPSAVYTITPVENAVYTIGATADGIKTMTVNTGNEGINYFSIGISPVITHSGDETAVFAHWRNDTQLELNATRGDFDLVNTATAGFNVLPGDMVKVYLLDELTNAVDFNPRVLQ